MLRSIHSHPLHIASTCLLLLAGACSNAESTQSGSASDETSASASVGSDTTSGQVDTNSDDPQTNATSSDGQDSGDASDSGDSHAMTTSSATKNDTKQDSSTSDSTQTGDSGEDSSTSADESTDSTDTTDTTDTSDTSTGDEVVKWSFIGISDSRGSDTGVNSSAAKKIVPKIVELNPDLVVYPGDLASSGPVYELEYWLELWQPVYDAGIEVYPVPGNHEGDAAAWQQVFATGAHSLPSNGPDGNSRTYYVEYNNALFVGLEWSYNDTQWLADTLASRGADKDHLIVFQHEPLLGRSHSGSPYGPAIASTMQNAGAQFFIAGHDHMNDHALVNNSLHQYIVGSAGAPFYSKGAYKGSSGLSATDVEPGIGENVYGFVYFEIEGKNVDATIHYLEGSTWKTGQTQHFTARTQVVSR